MLMVINKGILQSGIFYTQHLDPDNAEDQRVIKDFYIEAPEGRGLIRYLQENACDEEIRFEMRTYLVRLIRTDECVGYFSLKSGLISLNEVEVEVEDDQTGKTIIEREFDTLPGVELANFAVNSAFIKRYPYLKGVGHVILTEFILPLIREATRYIGIKMVYIFALPYDRLIARYESYGFRRLPETDEYDLHNRLKPRYDESCRFMYLLLDTAG